MKVTAMATRGMRSTPLPGMYSMERRVSREKNQLLVDMVPVSTVSKLKVPRHTNCTEVRRLRECQPLRTLE